MRYVIELRRTEDDRVEGILTPDGAAEGRPFSGWAELLSLLEPPELETVEGRRHDRCGERL